jgi:thiamine kinase-like enzyme
MAKRTRNAPADIPSFEFSNFVLSHLDISPRNLILDPDGRVWLIDWAYAGGYPPIFEAATLASQGQFPDFNQDLLSRISYDPVFMQQFSTISSVMHFWDSNDQ